LTAWYNAADSGDGHTGVLAWELDSTNQLVRQLHEYIKAGIFPRCSQRGVYCVLIFGHPQPAQRYGSVRVATYAASGDGGQKDGAGTISRGNGVTRRGQLGENAHLDTRCSELFDWWSSRPGSCLFGGKKGAEGLIKDRTRNRIDLEEDSIPSGTERESCHSSVFSSGARHHY